MAKEDKIYSSPYFKYSLNGLQRLITNTNTDNLSNSFGSSHRDFWLYKTSDFSDSVRNFSSNAFALASTHPYFSSSQKNFLKELAKASILFWTKIQHKDGSFDEFYPYERGWVGPTAFTLYSNIEAFQTISETFTELEKKVFLKSVINAAKYITAGDKEGDDLANHHAMAYLSLMKTYELIQDERIYKDALLSFDGYLKYHEKNECWSLEYDGIDPGYLSASCSFLAKTLSINNNPDVIELIKIYSKTLKIFCFPDGTFAGPIGSRNTMHLYPYAFELLSEIDQNILQIAKFSQFSLETGNAINPDLMSDRYLPYRVEEYLSTDKIFLLGKAKVFINNENYRDSSLKNEIYLKKAGIYHKSDSKKFITVNLAKNLVINAYEKKQSESKWERFSFTGTRILDKKGLYTSQYISKKTKYKIEKNILCISGYLAKIPTENSFNLPKNILFRIALIFCSQSTVLSNLLKKIIRKILMFSKKDNKYKIDAKFDMEKLIMEIKISSKNSAKPIDINFGTNISDRYVPQSRFARISDMELNQSLITKKDKLSLLKELKTKRRIICKVNFKKSP